MHITLLKKHVGRALCIAFNQELIRPRNSHVTVAQVTYDVIYTYVIKPYLKYRSCLSSFEEIQI